MATTLTSSGGNPIHSTAIDDHHASTSTTTLVSSSPPLPSSLVLTSQPSHGITVKTVFQGDTRRFVLDDVKNGHLFANLSATVQLVYKLNDEPFTISYIDDEGDSVVVDRDDEFRAAIDFAEHCGKILKLTVRLRPNPVRREQSMAAGLAVYAPTSLGGDAPDWVTSLPPGVRTIIPPSYGYVTIPSATDDAKRQTEDGWVLIADPPQLRPLSESPTYVLIQSPNKLPRERRHSGATTTSSTDASSSTSIPTTDSSLVSTTATSTSSSSSGQSVDASTNIGGIARPPTPSITSITAGTSTSTIATASVASHTSSIASSSLTVPSSISSLSFASEALPSSMIPTESPNLINYVTPPVPSVTPTHSVTMAPAREPLHTTATNTVKATPVSPSQPVVVVLPTVEPRNYSSGIAPIPMPAPVPIVPSLPESIQMPQHQHLLRITTHPDAHWCDICRDNSLFRSFTCSTCNYDMCIPCYHKLIAARSSSSSVTVPTISTPTPKVVTPNPVVVAPVPVPVPVPAPITAVPVSVTPVVARPAPTVTVVPTPAVIVPTPPVATPVTSVIPTSVKPSVTTTTATTTTATAGKVSDIPEARWLQDLPARVDVKSVHDHSLFLHVHSDNHWCDACKSNVVQSFYCQPCNYDLCIKCYCGKTGIDAAVLSKGPSAPRVLPAATILSRAMSLAYPLARDMIKKQARSEMNPMDVTASRDWSVLGGWGRRENFSVPSLAPLSVDYREVVQADLLQADHVKHLNAASPKLINYHESLTTMVPLRTTGDGNCLLHSASLATWGVHDRDLLLRGALNRTMNGRHTAGFRRRWQVASKLRTENESKWANRWTELVRQTTLDATNGPDGQCSFEYLEQTHIFVLAHVLRRPIIVYADSVMRNAQGEAIYTLEPHETMAGIYLPMEWTQPITDGAPVPSDADIAASITRSPICLTFCPSHFAGLVPVIGDGRQANESHVPLVDSNGQPLHVHFLLDHDLASYRGRMSGDELERLIVAPPPPPKPVVPLPIGWKAGEKSGPCQGGCGFNGQSVTAYMCSVCYKKNHPTTPVASPLSPSPAAAAVPPTLSKPSVSAGLISFLSRWMDVTTNGAGILVARQAIPPRAAHSQALFDSYIRSITPKVEERIRRRGGVVPSNMTSQSATSTAPLPLMGQPVACVGYGGQRCDFMGSTASRHMCSKCYRAWSQHQQQLQLQSHATITPLSSAASATSASIQRPLAVPVTHTLPSPWGVGKDTGPCVAGCGFTGSRATDFLCSKCYAQTSRMTSFRS